MLHFTFQIGRFVDENCGGDFWKSVSVSWSQETDTDQLKQLDAYASSSCQIGVLQRASLDNTARFPPAAVAAPAP